MLVSSACALCVMNGEPKIIDLADAKAPTIVDAITSYLASVDLRINTMQKWWYKRNDWLPCWYCNTAKLKQCSDDSCALHC